MRFYHNGTRFVPSGTTVLLKSDSDSLLKWAAGCAVDYVDKNYHSDSGPMLDWRHVGPLARTAYKDKSQEAMDYGTFVHWMCEQYLRGHKADIPKCFPVTDDDGSIRVIQIDQKLTKKFFYGFDYTTEKTKKKKHAEGFYDWCERVHLESIAIEHEVVGDWYGGRLDLVCEMDSFWMDKKWCKEVGVEWYEGIDKQRVIVLIDFKTGKGTYYKTWAHQLAGYRKEWNESGCDHYGVRCDGTPDKDVPCNRNCGQIQNHGVLKFNKETGKINYKDFTKYSATRVKVDGERVNGKVETEKYVRSWEQDWLAFKADVHYWWAQNGKECEL